MLVSASAYQRAPRKAEEQSRRRPGTFVLHEFLWGKSSGWLGSSASDDGKLILKEGVNVAWWGQESSSFRLVYSQWVPPGRAAQKA
jgi:hypothetical protein